MPSTTRTAGLSAHDAETFDQIAALLTQLERAVAVDQAEAPRMLRSLAVRARSVRGRTLRRTSQLLDDGSRAADELVGQVSDQAERILRSGLADLDRRVDEAEEVTAHARASIRLELRPDALVDLSANGALR